MDPKDEYYYDAMEHLGMGKSGAKKAIQFLQKALALDPHYAQTYVGLANAYEILGDKKKLAECVRKAYEETLKVFPVWPKTMPWGILENRAYLRAIQWMAEIFTEEDEKYKTIELYKLLLKLNPNDNQGIRYVLAGIYAGISGDDINKMFDEGNRKQNWDKLENLVKIQNTKHRFWKP